MTLLTSKSDFSGLAGYLTRKALSQGKVKLSTSTSHVSGHPLKLTLIRLKAGTLLEAKPRWLPSTPEQEDVYHFITSMKGNHYYSVSITIKVRLSDHRPFITASERFGYGSKSLEGGDTLCILNSSRTAHLIWRKEKGPQVAEVYQLINEALVHGMMYGKIKAFEIKEQDIALFF